MVGHDEIKPTQPPTEAGSGAELGKKYEYLVLNLPSTVFIPHCFLQLKVKDRILSEV